MPATRLLACLFAAACAPAAAEGQLDLDFGVDGFAIEGFQPAASGGDLADADIALATCAGPQGTLLVTGLASNGTRIVTIRLTPDGDLDPTFSGDGKASFDIREGAKSNALALCQADGKPVVAFAVDDALRNRTVIHVMRVNTTDGSYDETFAEGLQILDLHNLGFDARVQKPLGLTVGKNGDTIVTGRYERLSATRGQTLETYGFVARLGPTGNVLATEDSRSGFNPMAEYVNANLDSRGRLVAIGQARRSQGGIPALGRSILDYDTLQPLESGVWEGSPDNLAPSFGRMLGGDVVALAVTRYGEEPLVLLAPPVISQWRLVALPRPLMDGAPAFHSRLQLAPMADGGLLVMSTARAESGGTPSAVHAVKLRGSETGNPQPDPAFGSGGQVLIRRAANCGLRPLQFGRFTFTPTHVAVAATVDDCAPSVVPATNHDYAVFKLDGALFADGLEERWPVR